MRKVVVKIDIASLNNKMLNKFVDRQQKIYNTLTTWVKHYKTYTKQQIVYFKKK